MSEHILLVSLASCMPFLVIAFSKKAFFQKGRTLSTRPINNVIELSTYKASKTAKSKKIN